MIKSYIALFQPTPLEGHMSKKSDNLRHTIIGMVLFSAFLAGLFSSCLMVGCTTPPTPLHLLPGVPQSFLLSGVTITLTKTSDHFGDITARNTNNNGVRVLAERLDTSGVLLDKMYIAGGGQSYTAPGVVLEIGEKIHFRVRIWKSGFGELITCAVSEESCYQSDDSVTVVLE